MRGRPAFVLGEGARHGDDARLASRSSPDFGEIDAGDRLRFGDVAAERLLHRQRDLADGRLGARRFDAEREQIGVAARALGQRVERGLTSPFRRARRAGASSFSICCARTARRVDLEHVDLALDLRRVAVDADHRLLAGVDARLGARGRLLDAPLRQAELDRLGHAAERLDFVDMRARARREVGGQPLDVIGAAPRIDDARRAALLDQEQLGVAGDAGRERRRQRQRLVERVGVQRLGVSLRRRHRLDLGADDVVERVLRGQRPARSLAMGAQRQRLVRLRRRSRRRSRPTAAARRAAWRPP